MEFKQQISEKEHFERGVNGSHAWPGVNPSNINHELCHHTDDVTHGRASTPATSTMNSATTLMTSRMAGRQPQQHQP
jgi:hypothetical protein